MKRWLIVFLLASAVGLPLGAADVHCSVSKPIAECLHQIIPGFVSDDSTAAANPATGVDTAAATSAALKMTSKAVSAVNTGISSQVSPSQSTTKDFLSILSAALDIPTDSSGSKPFTFDYNLPVRFLGGDEELVKFQAVLAQPDLSSQLTDRLSGNADAVKKLKDSLSQADDATVSLTVDPSTQHLGRSITPHRDAFQSMLLSKMTFDGLRAMETLLVDNGLEKQDNQSVSIDKLFTPDPKNPNPKLKMKPEEAVAAIEAAAREIAQDVAPEFADKFSVLLNNQPQLYGAAIVHSLKDLAGPDEHSVKLTYEMGFNNLNAFYGDNSECRVDLSADCADKLVAFAKANGADDDTANRVAFSAEYRVAREWVVDLPQYSINFSAPKAHTFIYSASWGRNSHSAVFGGKSGRIDVAVNYENSSVRNPEDVVPLQVPGLRVARVDSVTTAPVRDRLVASVTFTQKLSDTLSMPFSLVYANHASFLGTVDRKLNAHFGINYKLPGGS